MKLSPATWAYAAVTAVVAVALGVDTAASARSADTAATVLDIVLAAVLFVLVLARRRSPVLSAAAGVGVAGLAAVAGWWVDRGAQPGVAACLALGVLGAGAVRVATRRAGAVLAVAGAVVLVLCRAGLRPAMVLPAALGGLLVWGAALGLGLWFRYTDAHRLAAFEAARHAERHAIARDLHDVVAHHVAAIVIQAQAAQTIAGFGLVQTKTTDADVEAAQTEAAQTATEMARTGAEQTVAAQANLAQVHAVLARIEASGGEALVAMRRVVGLLRQDGPADLTNAAPVTPIYLSPGALDTPTSPPAQGAPLTAAGLTLPTGPNLPARAGSPLSPAAAPEPDLGIAGLVDRFTASGRPVSTEVTDTTSWPPAVVHVAYRVVQEALTNVVLHAPTAQNVTVVVRTEAGWGVVEIQDDGLCSQAKTPRRPSNGELGAGRQGTIQPGPDYQRSGGFGLMGMRERVERLGGSVQTGPLPDGGWAVTARLPLVTT